MSAHCMLKARRDTHSRVAIGGRKCGALSNRTSSSEKNHVTVVGLNENSHTLALDACNSALTPIVLIESERVNFVGVQ